MNRREFLKQVGLLSLTVFLAPWQSGLARISDPVTTHKRIVVILLRGAVDGLSVVVPCGEGAYYDLRPSIAIPAPGQPNGALALDNHFGLHPALGPLMPFWQQQQLAFVQAAGSPDPSRSHFEAQDYMETGFPGNHTIHDGWMNRLLGVMPGERSSTQAINFGPTIPRILSGVETVANIEPNNKRRMLVDRPVISRSFDQLYNGSDILSQEYHEGRQARQEISTDLQQEEVMANNGAPLPNGFSLTSERLATLIRKDPHIQMAFMDLGGWDTHVNQGSSQGQLSGRLKPLGEGLAVLMNALGPELDNTSIIVMSEFGRTVKENGNRGTDHGHGNVMWLMGGGLRGGKVYGDWPGLSDAKRYEGRDLAITTDFRSVLSLVLQQQMNLKSDGLSVVFPEFHAGINRHLANLFE